MVSPSISSNPLSASLNRGVDPPRSLAAADDREAAEAQLRVDARRPPLQRELGELGAQRGAG